MLFGAFSMFFNFYLIDLYNETLAALGCECELYLKQPWNPPQGKIIMPFRILNYRLAIKLDNGRLSLSLKIMDHAIFALMMSLKNEIH